MRKFVHLSMVLLLLSIAMAAVCPVVAQEPAVEETEAETGSEEAEAAADAEAEPEGEHAVAVEDAAEAPSPDHADDVSALGAEDNTPIALLLTGMILLFALGAVAIRRL